MALRVVAGSAKGRRLVAPKSGARPTTDRVKESLFNALGADRVVGAAVLDLYAGSGALGIEALSRGASRAVFVDDDRRAVDAIRANLSTTGFDDRADVLQLPVASLAARPPPGAPFDLVLLDPPYDRAYETLTGVLAGLSRPGTLAPAATVVVESGRRPGGSGTRPWKFPEGWTVRWERAYGDTLLTIATP